MGGEMAGHMNKEKEVNGRSYEGLLAVLLLSAALIGVGVILLLYPDIRFENFCRLLGGVMAVFGLWKIIRYLIRAEYRNITNYDLSIGLILASIGVCLISEAARFGQSGVQFMGFLVLISAVIMIQYALQIRFLDGKLFPLALIIALANYAFGMLAIVEPRSLFHTFSKLFYILLIVSGVCGLFSLCLAWVRTRNKTKEERRDAERILEEDPSDMGRGADPGVFMPEETESMAPDGMELEGIEPAGIEPESFVPAEMAPDRFEPASLAMPETEVVSAPTEPEEPSDIA